MNFVKPDGSDITGNNMLLRKYLCSRDIHSEIYVSENVQDSRTDFENVDRKQEENYMIQTWLHASHLTLYFPWGKAKPSFEIKNYSKC